MFSISLRLKVTKSCFQFKHFHEIISICTTPILINFCTHQTQKGPSKMMAQEVAKVEAVMRDRVRIVHIDIDKYPSFASRFQIEKVPTSMLFQNGYVIGRFKGIISAQQLKGLISAKLSKRNSKSP